MGDLREGPPNIVHNHDSAIINPYYPLRRVFPAYEARHHEKREKSRNENSPEQVETLAFAVAPCKEWKLVIIADVTDYNA